MTTNEIITIHNVLKSADADAEAKAKEAATALRTFKDLHEINDWGTNVKDDCREAYDSLLNAMNERRNEWGKCTLALNAFLDNEWN